MPRRRLATTTMAVAGAVMAGVMAMLVGRPAETVSAQGQVVRTPTAPAPGAERARQFPVTLHPHDIKSTFISMPLPPGQEAYGRIQGDRLHQFVQEIAAISRKSRDDGDLQWGRIAGTKYDDLSEALVEQKFKQWGLQNIRRQYFDLPPQWFPTKWAFSLTSGGKTLTFRSIQAVRNAAATPPAGLDLDVVWVGLGTDADFAGKDVKGKLVVIKSYPTPSVVGHSAGWNAAMQRAADRGATAALINIAIPGNIQTAVSGAAGLTAFSLGTDDMNTIQDLLAKGGARAHLQLSTEMRSGTRDANVWGELPGTSDEDIIVMAHHDAFFEGATDNASGMAVMLGLAEYYAKVPQAQRRRTLKFVTTSGHHVGSLGTRWMHDQRDTFLAKTALLINCEHVSAIQIHFDRFGPGLRRSNNISARRWWVYGSSRLAALTLDAWKMFGVTHYEDMDPTTTGDMSHIDRDAPSIQLIESPLYYHTDQDTPDYVPAPGLQAVARAYAKIIDEANKIDRLALLPPASTTSAGRR